MPAHIEFGGVMGGGAPVYTGLRAAQTIATTTSTQSAPAQGGEYATVHAIDAAIMVAIGPNPTALASGVNMRFVGAGQIRDFGPLKEGDRIAAIDAA